MDAIRASRGEVAPYDDGHDFSSRVYNVIGSAWLAERHAYEVSNYETPLLETHQHYLFRFHDEFVETIAQGIWFNTVSPSDPFVVGAEHPGSALPLGHVVDQGQAHGLAWQVRSTEVDKVQLVSNSALVRTRDGRTRTNLTRPWAGLVATAEGVATPKDFAREWDEYCRGVAERRREMGISSIDARAQSSPSTALSSASWPPTP